MFNLTWNQIAVFAKYYQKFKESDMPRMSPQETWNYIQFGDGYLFLDPEERVLLDVGKTTLFPEESPTVESVLSWVTSPKIGWLLHRPYHFEVDGLCHGVLTIGDVDANRPNGELTINNKLSYGVQSQATFLKIANGTGWVKVSYVIHVLDEENTVQVVINLYKKRNEASE
jgi:hypothetical protein